MVKVGRNQSCPCGSSKKYKKCCGAAGQFAQKPRRINARSQPTPVATHPAVDVNNRIQKLVVEIRGLQPELQRMADAFRKDIEDEDPKFDKWCASDWSRNVFGNAFVRLCLLTENNFQFVEQMGLLAVARYIFELSVWLHLLNGDSRYGLVYYGQLLETQLRYYKDSAAQLRREVELLNAFSEKDKQFISSVRERVLSKESANTEFGNLLGQAMDAVDAEASRKFSLYLEDAKINGYALQASLVERKAIPPVEKAIRDIELEIAEFRSQVPQAVRDLVKGKWQWKTMADRVGLVGEYDYIYSFASKLLHATPASLTTDKKNLELQEVYIFLRYIYAKIVELIDLARLELGSEPTAVTAGLT